MVCLPYGERQRGCVYGLPLFDAVAQTIGVPADVTPVAPTGEQNDPAVTTLVRGAGGVVGGGTIRRGGGVVGAGATIRFTVVGGLTFLTVVGVGFRVVGVVLRVVGDVVTGAAVLAVVIDGAVVAFDELDDFADELQAATPSPSPSTSATATNLLERIPAPRLVYA